ncbi:MAG: hypothetical protein IJ440_06065 [Alphaproteobacteria bacterium]|nr:hypothetical protein [Alphaproteobacteria bacterium]
MKETMNESACLTSEEKKLLKQEIKEVWSELPVELKEYIIEVKRQKLKAMYMLQDWAKKNGHETMLDLLSRAITGKESKLAEMEKTAMDKE